MQTQLTLTRGLHQYFENVDASLTVGRDGLVYLGSHWPEPQVGLVLRCALDGQQQTYFPVGWNVRGNVTALAGSFPAAAYPYEGGVVLFDQSFKQLATFGQFTRVAYDTPSQVEAGSNRFYALDQHYIDPLNPAGGPVGCIVSLDVSGALDKRWVGTNLVGPGQNLIAQDFRVVEDPQGGGRFVIHLSDGGHYLRSVSFLKTGGQLQDDWAGFPKIRHIDGLVGFDTDAVGTTVALSGTAANVAPGSPASYPLTAIDPQGKLNTGGARYLAMPDVPSSPDDPFANPQPPITGVRIWQGQLVVKRKEGTELFLLFPLPDWSAPMLNDIVVDKIISIDFERVQVSLPQDPWTAGTAVLLSIDHGSVGNVEVPTLRWRLWASTAGATDWSEISYLPTSDRMSAAHDHRVMTSQLTLPSHLSGFVHFRISPELQPLHGDERCEYSLDLWGEVRRPASQAPSPQTSSPHVDATVTLQGSPQRSTYRRGETISLTTLARPANTGPLGVSVEVVNDDHPGYVLATASWTAPGGPFAVPSWFTAALLPGSYRIAGTSTQPGVTVAAWPFEIVDAAPKEEDGTPPSAGPRQTLGRPGVGMAVNNDVPGPPVWDDLKPISYLTATESAYTYARRLARLRTTRRLDPVQSSANPLLSWASFDNQILTYLKKRLDDNPSGTDPSRLEAALLPTPFQQLVGELSARAIDEVLWLLPNDTRFVREAGAIALLPPPPPATGPLYTALIRDLTTGLLSYPSFWGWQWGTNAVWPNVTDTGNRSCPIGWEWALLEGLNMADQNVKDIRSAYEKALDAVRNTLGAPWDAKLVDAATTVKGIYDQLWQAFSGAVQQAGGGGLRTSTALPWGWNYIYPPDQLQKSSPGSPAEIGVDVLETEQFPVPYCDAHSVDYFRRPDQAINSSASRLNESGTGEQIGYRISCQLMRGASAVGHRSFNEDHSVSNGIDDPRLTERGRRTVLRTLGQCVEAYGPWLASLQLDDDIAIIVCERMAHTTNYDENTPEYFWRTFEAYTACMFAHYPARIRYSTDLSPGDLDHYAIVLLVGLQVEPEDNLKAVLRHAQSAGKARRPMHPGTSTTIFYDATCRAELFQGQQGIPAVVPGAQALPDNLGFSHYEQNPRDYPGEDPYRWDDNWPSSRWYQGVPIDWYNSDAAWWRFRRDAMEDARLLAPAFKSVLPPQADLDEGEVFLTRHTSGSVECMVVVNAATTPLNIGELWRITIAAAVRTPLAVEMGLGTGPGAIYDVLALKSVPVTGSVLADLRDCPFRIFACLPVPIAKVKLKASPRASAGARINWEVQVTDQSGRTIDGPVPIRVQLLGPNGVLFDRPDVVTGPGQATGDFIAPFPDDPVMGAVVRYTLRASELLSGITAEAFVRVHAPSSTATPDLDSSPVRRTFRAKIGAPAVHRPTPLEDGFGPHITDLAVQDNGVAGGNLIVGTANWNENLYGLDLNGSVQWQQRVGHGFVDRVLAAQDVFGAQGFDLSTGEGYHLYLGRPNDGTVFARVAGYGLPARRQVRHIPNRLIDTAPSFVVSGAGGWIASAGNGGVAVWGFDGGPWWSQDRWKLSVAPPPSGTWGAAFEQTPQLLAADANTLLIIGDGVAEAVNAATGDLVLTGGAALRPLAGDRVTAYAVSRTGPGNLTGTLALLTTRSGADRLRLISEGTVLKEFPAVGHAIAISAAPGAAGRRSERVAVAHRQQLSLYTAEDGLMWVLPADDTIRNPVFSPDDQRIAASTDLGTLIVCGVDGNIEYEDDIGEVAKLAWLPQGDLIVGTWMGKVICLRGPNTGGGSYQTVWRTTLRSKIDDPRPQARHAFIGDTWRRAMTNAEPVQPLKLPDVNLLAPAPGHRSPQFDWGQLEVKPPGYVIADLYKDPGDPTKALGCWFSWQSVGEAAENQTDPFRFRLDFRENVSISSITFIDDPDHPEAWVRSVWLEYDTGGAWTFAGHLLSDVTEHRHSFAPRIETTRLRFTLPWGIPGNVWLRQLIVEGHVLP